MASGFKVNTADTLRNGVGGGKGGRWPTFAQLLGGLGRCLGLTSSTSAEGNRGICRRRVRHSEYRLVREAVVAAGAIAARSDHAASRMADDSSGQASSSSPRRLRSTRMSSTRVARLPGSSSQCRWLRGGSRGSSRWREADARRPGPTAPVTFTDHARQCSVAALPCLQRGDRRHNPDRIIGRHRISNPLASHWSLPRVRPNRGSQGTVPSAERCYELDQFDQCLLGRGKFRTDGFWWCGRRPQRGHRLSGRRQRCGGTGGGRRRRGGRNDRR
jgi:hypothetical protein